VVKKINKFMDQDYLLFLTELKERIRTAQYEAAKAVNTHIVRLYWETGERLSAKVKDGWGKSVVETLSKDIQKEFPGISGFSVRNLWYMKQFYDEYSGNEKLQPLVAEISWSKHLIIMGRCKSVEERQFYIITTKKMGWTKAVLMNKIELKSFEKFLLGQSNFEKTLSSDIKNQAILAIQDEYSWDFAELDELHSERDLEEAIIKNIRAFLLEFGPDFSFMGNQFRIEVDDKEYFIDLLLYHRKMQSLIAIDLKIGEFMPEHKGKMEFYLNILNEKVKLEHENPAIGIIICKSKRRMIVEYALKDSNKPIGVATYSLSTSLPEKYKDFLPDTQLLAKKIAALVELFEHDR
jgi:predicted nuclease of restriction endonuclease-like (RecB) superfamily